MPLYIYNFYCENESWDMETTSIQFNIHIILPLSMCYYYTSSLNCNFGYLIEFNKKILIKNGIVDIKLKV